VHQPIHCSDVVVALQHRVLCEPHNCTQGNYRKMHYYSTVNRTSSNVTLKHVPNDCRMTGYYAIELDEYGKQLRPFAHVKERHRFISQTNKYKCYTNGKAARQAEAHLSWLRNIHIIMFKNLPV
jgi:hypothetical protein